MKKIVMPIAFITCISIVLICSAAWPVGPPDIGDKLPAFSLAVPRDSVDRGYLGLSFLGVSFKVPDLNARIAIIQIFSMYCPYCQAEAPNVNLLYDKIEKNPALKGKIKLIGIGAGNSAYEVGIFKKKYGIPFPLFPDKDFKTYERIGGEVRTPYFIVAKINTDGSTRVVYSGVGSLGNVDKFLEQIIKSAELK